MPAGSLASPSSAISPFLVLARTVAAQVEAFARGHFAASAGRGALPQRVGRAADAVQVRERREGAVRAAERVVLVVHGRVQAAGAGGRALHGSRPPGERAVHVRRLQVRRGPRSVAPPMCVFEGPHRDRALFAALAARGRDRATPTTPRFRADRGPTGPRPMASYPRPLRRQGRPLLVVPMPAQLLEVDEPGEEGRPVLPLAVVDELVADATPSRVRDQVLELLEPPKVHFELRVPEAGPLPHRTPR